MRRIIRLIKEKLQSNNTSFSNNKEILHLKPDKTDLGNYLLKKGIISQEQIERALEYQNENKHKKIGEILYEINILGYEELLKQLSNFLNVNYIMLSDKTFPLTLQKMFKKKTMVENLFVPFDISGNIISIAISDINNSQLKHKIEQGLNSGSINYHASYYLALPSMIKNFIYNSYAKHPHCSDILAKRKKFGEYLIEKHIVTKEQLDEILNQQQKFMHKRLGELLYEMKILDREQTLRELAEHENKEYESLEGRELNEELIKLFKLDFILENYFIPFDKDENIVKIAVNNIFNDEHIEHIESEIHKHGLEAKFYISSKDSISRCHEKIIQMQNS